MPVLLAVDDFQAFYCTSRYRDHSGGIEMRGFASNDQPARTADEPVQHGQQEGEALRGVCATGSPLSMTMAVELSLLA